MPTHVPVLAEEILELTAPRPGDVVLDLTVGLGGHAVLLGKAIGPTGKVIAFDLDAETLAIAAQRLRDRAGCDVETHHASFVEAPRILDQGGRRADVVLADLGFSSVQMDTPERGFSFRADGPLDMRFDPARGPSAADLLARMSEREIAKLIKTYGEDPFAGKIARKLAQSRQEEPIRTTAQLAKLVREAYGARARASRMHPATRTFMALRICVNDELAALQLLLDHIRAGVVKADEGGWLQPDARVAVVSFHSLEDRAVKRAFVSLTGDGLVTRLTKRPITATEAEIDANPRARSAKLRAVRLGGSST